LTAYERRWLEEEIESPRSDAAPVDKSEHPLVTQINEAVKAKDIELAKENGRKKEQALADARNLLDRASGLASERRVFLPEKLRRRLSENQSAQEEEIGWQANDDD
jgi:hypothetical protein